MAQQMGGIDPLLDSFFGFMRRKTDFFVGAASGTAAQETVLKAFEKNRARADEETKEKAAKEKAEIRERSKLWEMSDAEKAEIREKSKLRQRQDSPIKEISSDINVLSSDAREKK